MQNKYYDPLFYISSDEMPFSIRIEITMKDDIERKSLEYAVSTATKRYPYFKVRIVRDGESYTTVPNPLPVTVFEGTEPPLLGSEQTNFHIMAVGFSEKTVYLHITHVVTDGGGFSPFMKTLLYYYISSRYGVELDPTGINLADSPVFDDETSNPYPEEKMRNAAPLYTLKKKDYFRLTDGGNVTDTDGRVFRFKVKEKDLIDFSFDHDGSPCALISVLMAKAIWSLHPLERKDIVGAVSFNLRPALENRHNYRLLCSAIMLRYASKLRNEPILHLCTCSRGMITVQSQPENVLYYTNEMQKWLESVNSLETLEEKKRICSEKALKDSIDNTFSISYVGRLGLGVLEPYIESIYNITDGSTYKTAFIEVSSVNGYFDISLIQGFSSDIYYKELLKKFSYIGIPYTEESISALNTAKLALP